MIPVEVFDATNKITFVIFDWDAKKIIKKICNKSFWKTKWGTTYWNYCKTFDHNIYKIYSSYENWYWRRNPTWFEENFRLNSFEWIQSKDGFEIYIVTKIFYAPSNDKNIWKIKRKIHNPICYINSFATLFLIK